MNMSKDALDMLKETSRTFFIPISRLPARLHDAVMSAYLCLRAIDEVEDHPKLDNSMQATLLRSISRTLQTTFSAGGLRTAIGRYRKELPLVTFRVGDWALFAPSSIAPVCGRQQRPWQIVWPSGQRMAG
jgi:farnesyl-diphosphate farnesyltransferase